MNGWWLCAAAAERKCRGTRYASGHVVLARIAVTMTGVLCISNLHAAPGNIVVGARPLTWLKSGNYSALDRYLTDLQLGFESGGVWEEKLYQGFLTRPRPSLTLGAACGGRRFTRPTAPDLA